MKINRRNFIISDNHRRLQRLWRFFFTGWGLFMIAVLFAGAFLNRSLQLIPTISVDMTDVAKNQFRMTNMTFAGVDADGNPFRVTAAEAHQEFGNADNVIMRSPRANVTRDQDGKKVRQTVVARTGSYDRGTRKITLTGDVKINSDGGDTLIANEIVIKI